jgi:dTDP-4-amino-4,6-dideoxygalactose transaminase
MSVPFLDLKAQYVGIRSEINTAIQEVLDSGAFAGGPFVERFEKEWAACCGAKHAVGVGNGTDALWLILLSLGIGSGDEVITVPNSFIATAEAISLTGATPVFVDVGERFLTMDPELLESAITLRTKAIIPVHLFGQMADMDPILEVARRHGVPIVEDACQAHGARYKGRTAGSVGDAAAFSFYPGKNLGAYGEAGAVVTNDTKLAERIRILRDHGQRSKYYHEVVGMNARMDGIQGAILTVKLKHLEAWNTARIQHAATYSRLLEGIQGLTLQRCAPYARHVYHIYGVRVASRDRVLEELKKEGISCGVHYPVPIDRQKAYEHLRLDSASYPVSGRSAEELLSLPMYPELTDEKIHCVTDSLKRTLAASLTTMSV